MESIHIVTATNDKYAIHLGVMLNSLLINRTKKTNMQISIIDGGISQKNQLNLERVVTKFGAKINFLNVDHSLFNGFKVVSHISKETYYRIVIPDLLDKSINKVLYLDCDLIVKGDITKLWNTSIKKYHLAAVEKAYLKDSERKAIELPKGSRYFNAGVLLINIEKWRDQQISNKLLKYINENSEKITYPSQDPLNAILYNKWLKLDPKWNYTTGHCKLMPKKKPSIIHFTGNKKPWNKGHPLQKEYQKYLRKTLWK